MDILFVYNGWKDSESLRYAMRSIAKNGRNVGRVYLVSVERPEWCSKEVTHIPYINTRNLYKENDINEAIYTAVEKSDISDHFLIAGDDYFYINPTDFDHYPIYRKNAELPAGKDPTGRMGGWKYVQALFNSRVLLTAAGLPCVNYSQHAMFPGDRKLMQKYRHIFDAAMMMEFGVVFDSVMANIIVKHNKKAVVVDRKDNKIERASDIGDLLQQIGETEVFSTATRAIDENMRAILNQLFPDKSKYEI